MRDMKNKCIAAVASMILTAAIFLSLSAMAEASGVPDWIRAAESQTTVAADWPRLVHG